jgi:transcriptional regulator with XRE-family HTH domain
MRHGSRLDYAQLKSKAHEALSESGLTQQALAERLGVARSSVARAVTQAGPKFQQLQMQIIEALTEYTVERLKHVEFRTWRKDRTDRSE